ncbi:MAG: type I methionyl aminopeptidase [Candidatus Saccharimonadales bacterium]
MLTKVKTTSEITAMRESGRMLATVLELLRKEISVGMSTKDLAIIANKELQSLGGEPTFLGYYGFPDVLCVSVNEEVVHGIPQSKKIIHDGDIVSMDFGVTYQGMITDAAISVVVGHGSSKAINLVRTTRESLLAGIEASHSSVRVGTIANAVQKVLDSRHYGIVRDLVGHGVGHHLHEDPNIPNYGKPDKGAELLKHMTIAIEPMATMGDYHVTMAPDGWTVLTQDKSWAAHFEHTILLTTTGAEILTEL